MACCTDLGVVDMQKRAHTLTGAGLAFALGLSIGFYAGQRHPEPGAVTGVARPLPVGQPAAVAGGAHRAGLPHGPGRTVYANPRPAAEPVQPFDGQGLNLADPPPSPDDIARQDAQHAGMIASLRAARVPEEHITLMEESYAAQKLSNAQPRPQNVTPLAARPPAELAADLEQTLKQAGVPAQDIEIMTHQLFPQAYGIESASTNVQPLDPPPGLPGPPR